MLDFLILNAIIQIQILKIYLGFMYLNKELQHSYNIQGTDTKLLILPGYEVDKPFSITLRGTNH